MAEDNLLALMLLSGRVGTFKKSFKIRGAPRLTPAVFAEAGFSYLGPKDMVRCPFCLIELGDWEPNDVPWQEHIRRKSDCPFILFKANHNQKFNDLMDCCSSLARNIFDVTYAENVQEIRELNEKLSKKSK